MKVDNRLTSVALALEEAVKTTDSHSTIFHAKGHGQHARCHRHRNVDFAQLATALRAVKREESSRKRVVTLIVLAFLLYPQQCLNTYNMVTCEELHDGTYWSVTGRCGGVITYVIGRTSPTYWSVWWCNWTHIAHRDGINTTEQHNNTTEQHTFPLPPAFFMLSNAPRHTRLVAAHNIQCFEGAHYLLTWCCFLPAMLFFVIGIPFWVSVVGGGACGARGVGGWQGGELASTQPNNINPGALRRERVCMHIFWSGGCECYDQGWMPCAHRPRVCAITDVVYVVDFATSLQRAALHLDGAARSTRNTAHVVVVAVVCEQVEAI